MISLVNCKVKGKATLLPSDCGCRRPKWLQIETKYSCDHIKILFGIPAGDLRAVSPMSGEAGTTQPDLHHHHGPYTLISVPLWLEREPQSLQENQSAVFKCLSRKLEGETNSFAGQRPLREVQGKAFNLSTP